MAVQGTVTVVAATDEAAALRLVAEGAAVIVAGTDPGAVGELVARLREAGGRVAGMVAEVADPAGRAAVVEMAGELFPELQLVMEEV